MINDTNQWVIAGWQPEFRPSTPRIHIAETCRTFVYGFLVRLLDVRWRLGRD